MGVWIGGLFTYEAVKTIAERGDYALSIITPGLNKAEVVKAVKHLGKDFDQIIIGSYPPILKDILDDGVQAGAEHCRCAGVVHDRISIVRIRQHAPPVGDLSGTR